MYVTAVKQKSKKHAERERGAKKTRWQTGLLDDDANKG